MRNNEAGVPSAFIGVSTACESSPELSQKVLGSGFCRGAEVHAIGGSAGRLVCRAILVCAELGAVLGSGIHA